MIRIGVWTIRLMRNESLDDVGLKHAKEWDDENQEVHDIAQGFMGQLENQANEWLPEGFYIKIEDN